MTRTKPRKKKSTQRFVKVLVLRSVVFCTEFSVVLLCNTFYCNLHTVLDNHENHKKEKEKYNNDLSKYCNLFFSTPNEKTVVDEVDCRKPWVLVPRTTHSVPRLKTRSVSLRNLVDQASDDVPNEFCQSNNSNDVINIMILLTSNNLIHTRNISLYKVICFCSY